MKYVVYKNQKYLGYFSLLGVSLAGAYQIFPMCVSSYIPAIGYVWAMIFCPWVAAWSGSCGDYYKNVLSLNGIEYDKSLSHSHVCVYRVYFSILKKTNELIFDTENESQASHWKATGNKISKIVQSSSCLLYGDWIGEFDSRLVTPEKRQELYGAYTTEIRKKYPHLSGYSIKIEYSSYVGQDCKYAVLKKI